MPSISGNPLAPLPLSGAWKTATTSASTEQVPAWRSLLLASPSGDGTLVAVGTAAHGSFALKKLQTRAYDLILRDLRMPECDGPALYHELQPKPEPEEKLCHP
jgi:CheY-like chemotaxis protein